MPKSTFFSGQPILNQLINLIPRHLVHELSSKHEADHYCKRFMSQDHLITMLYACFHKSTSLRELITGLQANSTRLTHLGFKHTPRRSTLSDANKRRPVAFFADLYHALYEMHFLSDSQLKKNKTYLIDSTTIPLFSEIMKGAGSYKANGRKKGGAKAHVLLDFLYQVPAFVRITEARHNDIIFLADLNLPKGSTVVFDKAYIKHSQFQQWDRKGVVWLTRTKKDAYIVETDQLKVSEESYKLGVRKDRLIQLGRPSNKRTTEVINAREVWFRDEEKGRDFRFITNDLEASPERIAQLYKSRWDIELVFKRIKQTYPLKYFLGDNPNAVQIQIWCTLICDLLVQIVKKKVEQQSKKRWAYANLAAMIKHHLMTYIDLISFLSDPEKTLLQYKPPEQFQYKLFT